MTSDYDIGLATPDDIAGILALQEANLIEHGGTLSVRLPAEWYARAMQDMRLIVARRNGRAVGYVAATSLEAQMHIPIVQAMVAKFPPPSNCYFEGPVCVAASKRGRGLVATIFAETRKRLPGRPAVTFIRSDNAASLRAHDKMGMRILGEFETNGVRYTALAERH